MMEFCAVAIKWSRSNDNFETYKKKTQIRNINGKKGSIMNSKPVHADYTRKLQKVLFIYILPLSFGLFQTKRKKTTTLSMCTLSFLRQRYFRFISDFRVFALNAKSEITTATAIEEKNGCNHFLQFFVSQYSQLYSLFEQNMKRKMCFCFSFFIL